MCMYVCPKVLSRFLSKTSKNEYETPIATK